MDVKKYVANDYQLRYYRMYIMRLIIIINYWNNRYPKPTKSGVMVMRSHTMLCKLISARPARTARAAVSGAPL